MRSPRSFVQAGEERKCSKGIRGARFAHEDVDVNLTRPRSVPARRDLASGRLGTQVFQRMVRTDDPLKPPRDDARVRSTPCAHSSAPYFPRDAPHEVPAWQVPLPRRGGCQGGRRDCVVAFACGWHVLIVAAQFCGLCCSVAWP